MTNMKLDEIITLGELFEIQMKDLTVRTKLQEIISDSEFVVLQPTVKGVPARTTDQDVSFTFYRPNGCFSFKARMSPPFFKDDIRFCMVARVSDVERIQRRQCYRLPIVLDTFLFDPKEESQPNKKRWRGKTIDLSEKSVAVSCFASFEEDTPLAVEIKLTPTSKLTFQAKVLRCKKPDKPTDPHEVVLIFTNYDERGGAFLRKYIFNRQIESRRNKT